jgi:N,N'-diacetyllegionaminate synthase
MTILLRDANHRDGDFLVSLKFGVPGTALPENSQSIDYEQAKLECLAQISSASSRIYIAEDESGRELGCAVANNINSKDVDISFGVTKKLRSQGLGTQIVKMLMETIKSQFPRARRVNAWSPEDDYAAINVLIKNGFAASKLSKHEALLSNKIKSRCFTKSLDRVLIIGEAGVNHNGDMNLAKKLIDLAAVAGLDFVKFQTWITEELVDPNAPKASYQIKNDPSSSQYQMLKKLELSFPQFHELQLYAQHVGVDFLSTPDDYPSLDFLADVLSLPVIKIGSGELNNLPFLRRVGQKSRDVVLSTGMGSIRDVELAYDALINSGAKSVSLLHCTSNYPAAMSSVNLGAMQLLKKAFDCKVGYSDHTEGIEVSIAAVALGAQIIEKHYTIDRGLPGPDHIASIDPADLKKLVASVRNVELAISGSGQKRPHHSEVETKRVVSKGIYARRDINPGEVITEDILQFKRPATNLCPDQVDIILGRIARNKIGCGRPINLEDINFG